MKEQYPDKVMIILHKYKDSQMKPLAKTKFLANNTIQALSLSQQIRRTVGLRKDEPLFIFAGRNLVKQSKSQFLKSDNLLADSIGELERKYGDKDGILNLTYAETDPFGNYTELNKKVITILLTNIIFM